MKKILSIKKLILLILFLLPLGLILKNNLFSNFLVSAQTVNSPIGWLWLADCERISGYVGDKDRPTAATNVSIYYDQTDAAHYVGQAPGNLATINAFCTTLGAPVPTTTPCLHGFNFKTSSLSAEIRAKLFDGKPHKIIVWGKNIAGTSGTDALLRDSGKTITCSLPTPSPTDTPGGPTLTPRPTVTPGGPTVPPAPTNTPGGPTLTPRPTVTPGGPTFTPVPPTLTPSTGPCAKKAQGDANCDGNINEADFNLWKQEFDTMQPAAPGNQNANFACVEGNSQTYFVDLTDFEVWRRNTTSGLITSGSPGSPSSPSVTPSGGQRSASCTSTSNCLAGLCCVRNAAGTNVCQPQNTAGITCLPGTPGTAVTPTRTSAQQPAGGGNTDIEKDEILSGAEREAQKKLDRLNELENKESLTPEEEEIRDELKNEFGVGYDGGDANDQIRLDENKDWQFIP